MLQHMMTTQWTGFMLILKQSLSGYRRSYRPPTVFLLGQAPLMMFLSNSVVFSVLLFGWLRGASYMWLLRTKTEIARSY